MTEAFQRVLRGQKEWGKVGQTIADRKGQLGEDEWVNTQIFLRNSYMVGEDMRRVVRDAEPDKRVRARAAARWHGWKKRAARDWMDGLTCEAFSSHTHTQTGQGHRDRQGVPAADA